MAIIKINKIKVEIQIKNQTITKNLYKNSWKMKKMELKVRMSQNLEEIWAKKIYKIKIKI